MKKQKDLTLIGSNEYDKYFSLYHPEITKSPTALPHFYENLKTEQTFTQNSNNLSRRNKRYNITDLPIIAIKSSYINRRLNSLEGFKPKIDNKLRNKLPKNLKPLSVHYLYLLEKNNTTNYNKKNNFNYSFLYENNLTIPNNNDYNEKLYKMNKDLINQVYEKQKKQFSRYLKTYGELIKNILTKEIFDKTSKFKKINNRVINFNNYYNDINRNKQNYNNRYYHYSPKENIKDALIITNFKNYSRSAFKNNNDIYCNTESNINSAINKNNKVDESCNTKHNNAKIVRDLVVHNVFFEWVIDNVIFKVKGDTGNFDNINSDRSKSKYLKSLLNNEIKNVSNYLIKNNNIEINSINNISNLNNSFDSNSLNRPSSHIITYLYKNIKNNRNKNIWDEDSISFSLEDSKKIRSADVKENEKKKFRTKKKEIKKQIIQKLIKKIGANKNKVNKDIKYLKEYSKISEEDDYYLDEDNKNKNKNINNQYLQTECQQNDIITKRELPEISPKNRLDYNLIENRKNKDKNKSYNLFNSQKELNKNNIRTMLPNLINHFTGKNFDLFRNNKNDPFKINDIKSNNDDKNLYSGKENNNNYKNEKFILENLKSQKIKRERNYSINYIEKSQTENKNIKNQKSIINNIKMDINIKQNSDHINSALRNKYDSFDNNRKNSVFKSVEIRKENKISNYNDENYIKKIPKKEINNNTRDNKNKTNKLTKNNYDDNTENNNHIIHSRNYSIKNTDKKEENKKLSAKKENIREKKVKENNEEEKENDEERREKENDKEDIEKETKETYKKEEKQNRFETKEKNKTKKKIIMSYEDNQAKILPTKNKVEKNEESREKDDKKIIKDDEKKIFKKEEIKKEIKPKKEEIKIEKDESKKTEEEMKKFNRIKEIRERERTKPIKEKTIKRETQKEFDESKNKEIKENSKNEKKIIENDEKNEYKSKNNNKNVDNLKSKEKINQEKEKKNEDNSKNKKAIKQNYKEENEEKNKEKKEKKPTDNINKEIKDKKQNTEVIEKKENKNEQKNKEIKENIINKEKKEESQLKQNTKNIEKLPDQKHELKFIEQKTKSEISEESFKSPRKDVPQKKKLKATFIKIKPEHKENNKTNNHKNKLIENNQKSESPSKTSNINNQSRQLSPSKNQNSNNINNTSYIKQNNYDKNLIKNIKMKYDKEKKPKPARRKSVVVIPSNLLHKEQTKPKIPERKVEPEPFMDITEIEEKEETPFDKIDKNKLLEYSKRLNELKEIKDKTDEEKQEERNLKELYGSVISKYLVNQKIKGLLSKKEIDKNWEKSKEKVDYTNNLNKVNNTIQERKLNMHKRRKSLPDINIHYSTVKNGNFGIFNNNENKTEINKQLIYDSSYLFKPVVEMSKIKQEILDILNKKTAYKTSKNFSATYLERINNSDTKSSKKNSLMNILNDDQDFENEENNENNYKNNENRFHNKHSIKKKRKNVNKAKKKSNFELFLNIQDIKESEEANKEDVKKISLNEEDKKLMTREQIYEQRLKNFFTKIQKLKNYTDEEILALDYVFEKDNEGSEAILLKNKSMRLTSFKELIDNYSNVDKNLRPKFNFLSPLIFSSSKFLVNRTGYIGNTKGDNRNNSEGNKKFESIQ